VSDTHRRKQLSPKNSTDAGIMISINPVSENALFSIRDNFDPLSNLTSESEVHFEKQPSLKISTDAGIIISNNPVPENASQIAIFEESRINVKRENIMRNNLENSIFDSHRKGYSRRSPTMTV
jgi:hypothetical protein